MDFDLSTLAMSGLDIGMGLGYTGGEDKYVSALQRYYRSSGQNREKIASLLEADDIEGFAIVVHALKSNSRMIGAPELAAGFEKLEMAARGNDRPAVDAQLETVLGEYERTLEILRPLGEMDSFRAADEIDAQEARKTADELLEALDDFDDDLAASLAKKLAGYPFRITQKEKLRSASEKIGQFLYEEAAELIREIYPSIE